MSPFLKSELLPHKVTYNTGQSISIEVIDIPKSGIIKIWHLGNLLNSVKYSGDGEICLPPMPLGSYSIELEVDNKIYSTAIEVSDNPRSRLRYGFVASYLPGKNTDEIANLARRLHLTTVQFYDWAYRHADLLGGGENYVDTLDQKISLQSVRNTIKVLQSVGTEALGYAAVYAVGPEEWPKWEHLALLDGTGKAYGLGDFLFILDPSSKEWLEHFKQDLIKAASLGFDGFHLDQYGYPKRARAANGEIVDLKDSFCNLIMSIRDEFPKANLIFNNVNDFPTQHTVRMPQDVIYIEPWEPQTTLGALAQTVVAARGTKTNKPVVLAAYQNVYDNTEIESANSATALTMATLFSHGATQLLAGEGDRILVDPYYVRNHKLAPSTAYMLKRWYDFLVAQDELLMPYGISDVTNSYAGMYNGDIDVKYSDTDISHEAKAGTIWRRITEVDDKLIIHLINLKSQINTLWDATREPLSSPTNGQVCFKCILGSSPKVYVGDPDTSSHLVEIPIHVENGMASATLPKLNLWQMIVIIL